jgi:hypothetical protein
LAAPAKLGSHLDAKPTHKHNAAVNAKLSSNLRETPAFVRRCDDLPTLVHVAMQHSRCVKTG